MELDLTKLSDEELANLESSLMAEQDTHEPTHSNNSLEDIDLTKLSNQELYALEAKLKGEDPSVFEAPNPEESDIFTKRGILRRLIPATKSFLTMGMYPQLFDPAEEKFFGKENRPRNEREASQARWYEGVGMVPSLMTGFGGALGAAGKGLAALGSATKGGKILKAASALTKAGKATRAAALNPAEMLGSGYTTQYIAPEVEKMHPLLGIPAGVLGGAAITGGIRGLMRAPTLPARTLGIDPEKVEAFQKAGMPYTLGDVAPKMAAIQTSSQQLIPGNRLEKVYAKRAKKFEEMTPTNFDVGDTAERIMPAANKYAASQREIQNKLAKEVSEEAKKAGISTFTPTKTRQVFEDYFQSLAQEGARIPQQVPKKFQGIFKQINKDNIPIYEARKAGEGLLDRLNKMLPEKSGVALTREQRMASQLRKSIGDDILDEIEKRAPSLSATEKTRRGQWKDWLVEQKQHEKIVQPESLPLPRMASVVKDFEQGGNILPRLLTNVPETEQKDFFNSMVRGLSTYRGQHSIIYLAKRFNTLPKSNQDFLIQHMKKFNDVDGDKLRNLFKSQQLAGVTEKTLNTSRTAPTAFIYEAEKDLMKAASDMASGNEKGLKKSISNFAGRALVFLAAKAGSEKIFASKTFIDTLNYMNKISLPSQVPIALNKLEKIGINIKPLWRAWWKSTEPIKNKSARRAVAVRRAVSLGLGKETDSD